MGRPKGSKNHFPKSDCLGLSRTRLYRIWADMKTRCFNENCDYYKDYGSRGITVYKPWMDFINFRDWALKNGYQENLEIDRIDVGGNYEPNNCRFVTEKEQTINRRVTRWYTIGNKTLCLKDWCDFFGKKFNVVSYRLKNGSEIEEALTKKSTARITKDLYDINGIELTLKEWCMVYGIKWTTFLLRIRRGWAIEDALKKDVKKYKKSSKT
jgi:hypothetical protein